MNQHSLLLIVLLLDGATMGRSEGGSFYNDFMALLGEKPPEKPPPGVGKQTLYEGGGYVSVEDPERLECSAVGISVATAQQCCTDVAAGIGLARNGDSFWWRSSGLSPP